METAPTVRPAAGDCYNIGSVYIGVTLCLAGLTSQALNGQILERSVRSLAFLPFWNTEPNGPMYARDALSSAPGYPTSCHFALYTSFLKASMGLTRFSPTKLVACVQQHVCIYC